MGNATLIFSIELIKSKTEELIKRRKTKNRNLHWSEMNDIDMTNSDSYSNETHSMKKNDLKDDILNVKYSLSDLQGPNQLPKYICSNCVKFCVQFLN